MKSTQHSVFKFVNLLLQTLALLLLCGQAQAQSGGYREIIQAENSTRVSVKPGSGIVAQGNHLIGFQVGEWIRFQNVDLCGADAIVLSIGSEGAGRTFEVRVGSPTGSLLGTAVTQGGYPVWTGHYELTVPITELNGTADLYLVGKTAPGTAWVATVDWLGTRDFNASCNSPGVSPTPLWIEAEDQSGIVSVKPGSEIVPQQQRLIGFQSGEWVRFNALDLCGIDRITLSIGDEGTGRTILVRLDSPTGPLLSTVTTQGSNPVWTGHYQVSFNVADLQGVHDLYLVGGYAPGTAWVATFDAIGLTDTDTSCNDHVQNDYAWPLDPSAVTPNPGANEQCTTWGQLNGVTLDATDSEYGGHAEEIGFANPLPHTCQRIYQICDANDVPLDPRPLITAVNEGGGTGCLGTTPTPLNPCPMDPDSIGSAPTACNTDANCPAGKLCGIHCADAACASWQRVCGSPLASCGNTLQADNTPNADGLLCEEVGWECPELNSSGTFSFPVQAAAQLSPTQSANAPTMSTPAYLPPPPVFAESLDYCDVSEHVVPKDLQQGEEGANTLRIGSDNWGFSLTPTFKQVVSVDPGRLVEDAAFNANGKAGVDLGITAFGKDVSILSVQATAEAGQCGFAGSFETTVFGDDIAVTALGDTGGFDFATSSQSRDTCVLSEAGFSALGPKVEALRDAMMRARAAQEELNEKGATLAACRAIGTFLEVPGCGNIGGECCPDYALATDKAALSLDLDRRVREKFEAANTAYQGALNGFLAARGTNLGDGVQDIELFDFENRYTLVAFEQDIPIGPITLTVAVDAFGRWGINGAVRLRVTTSNIDTLTAEAGPEITPFAGVEVALFAGVGIPGVSIGLEGQITIIDLEFPVNTVVSVTRSPEADPRDRPDLLDPVTGSSVFRGLALAGVPVKLTQWNAGWSFGAGMEVDALDGTLNGAVRLKLGACPFCLKKTFRKKITSWDGGINQFYLLAGLSGGVDIDLAPIPGSPDFGKSSVDYAIRQMVPLTTADLPAVIDPEAESDLQLGSCIDIR